MAQDVTARYQTAAELREDLKPLTRESEANLPGVIRARQSSRRSRNRAAAAGVALVLVLAMIGYFLSRPAPPPRVLRTVQLTNSNKPKSDIVTDGSRVLYRRS